MGLSLEAFRIVFRVQNVRFSVRGMFEFSESLTTDGTFFIMRHVLGVMVRGESFWESFRRIWRFELSDPKTRISVYRKIYIYFFYASFSSRLQTKHWWSRLLLPQSTSPLRYTSDPFSSFFAFAVRFLRFLFTNLIIAAGLCCLLLSEGDSDTPRCCCCCALQSF